MALAALDEGQESHVASALDGNRYEALHLCRMTEPPPRQDAPPFVQATAESSYVLVVDVLRLEEDRFPLTGSEATRPSTS